MSGKGWIRSGRPKEIGDLYIGCGDLTITTKGKHTIESTQAGTDVASNVFIGCDNVVKDDRDADVEVRGSYGGSASVDVFHGCSDVTVKEEGSRKEVVGGGASGTETSITTVTDSENFNLEAAGSSKTIKAGSSPGSSAAFVILEGVKGATLDLT